MRNGYWRILVISSLFLALGGCGGDPPAPRSPEADQLTMLHRSMLENQNLRTAGLDPATNTGRLTAGQVNADPGRPCKEKLKSDADRQRAVQFGFSSETVQLLQRAFSYRSVDGADVVGQIRKVAKACDTYRTKSGRGDATYTLDRSVRLPAMDGLDASYAYCEAASTGEWMWWVCHVALAHGKVISTIEVSAATEKQTRGLLADLAPVAAHLLIKATSRP